MLIENFNATLNAGVFLSPAAVAALDFLKRNGLQEI